MFHLYIFPKGIGIGLSTTTPNYADYLIWNWETPLKDSQKSLVHEEIGLQGNIDPRLLYGSQPDIAEAMKYYIRFHKENKNWIMNLGHGFLPDIPYDNAKYLADLILESDWKS
ncbi:MAG: hypothetical protein IPO21_16355 [Bacteroidales bacterium]|nr:hypothetical protein [Bacteroidales bacterium]